MLDTLTSWLDISITLPGLGTISLESHLLFLLVFIGLFIGFYVLRNFLITYIKSALLKTNIGLAKVLLESICDIKPYVYTVISLYVALKLYSLPTIVDLFVSGVVYLVIVVAGIDVATKLIRYATSQLVEKDKDGDGEPDPETVNASHLITLIARIILWSLGILFVLSNLGIEVTALIAGLGIGGVAVAFALQGILSDLFASFSIYFDKPFRIGDFIVVDGDAGVVQHVGIKSTRLKTLQGEELVISNNELTSTRVHNFKKMSERRIVTTFGVTYETSYEYVSAIPSMVETIFKNLHGGRLDRIHFTEFADSALLFELVYLVESSDYPKYLEIQQEFNLALMKAFAEKGIQFAYPTQTIYSKSVS